MRLVYLLYITFSSIFACHCSWIMLAGPVINAKDNAQSSTSVEKLNEIDKFKDHRHMSTTEQNCCEYEDSEKEIEKSLNAIAELGNEEQILATLYTLIDDMTFSIHKVVNNLTFAVFIPEMMKEQNDTDLVWEYKEQSAGNADEINITLKREIVNEMEAKDIYFKLALLKYNIPANFKTQSRSQFNHGPFIIVKTTCDNEISIGIPVFQFKIDKRQLKYPNADWSCVFWNKETYTWESRGIATLNNDQHVICTSDHLSAFSIVMDPYSGYDENAYGEILTIISTVGSLLTIPCLIVTIIMYGRNRMRREKISSKILIYCCFSLLSLHSSFLLFTFFRETLPCWLLNFTIQYGGSSSLLWTAADGINMWRKLFVDIFDKKKSVFFRWSKIISWGFPLFSSVVGVTVTDYSNEECHIGFRYNLLLYMLPCVLILVTNAVFFIIMFVNVVYKDKIKSLSGKKKKYVMSLVQVFGLFWCISFPLLWLPETRLLGHILFTIFVSNQGIFIFYVRCIKEREIRRELLRYALKRKAFYRVMTISRDQNSHKNGKMELTGIFSISSGNTKCFTSSSEFGT